MASVFVGDVVNERDVTDQIYIFEREKSGRVMGWEWREDIEDVDDLPVYVPASNVADLSERVRELEGLLRNITSHATYRSWKDAEAEGVATSRVDALREAAEVCGEEVVAWRDEKFHQEALGAVHCKQAILALITKDASHD